MAVPVYNGWEIYRGAGFTGYVQITKADGTNYDLTGATLAVALKDVAGGTAQAGGTITTTVTSATTGQFHWDITAAGTTAITAGLTQVVFDIFITPSVGQAFCAVKGTIAVTARV